MPLQHLRHPRVTQQVREDLLGEAGADGGVLDDLIDAAVSKGVVAAARTSPLGQKHMVGRPLVRTLANAASLHNSKLWVTK